MNLKMSRFAVKTVSLALVALLAFLGGASAFAADVKTIAGSGASGFSGDNGPAIAASLFLPNGMAAAADGTVYIADTDNYRIRRVSPGGTITTVAGNGTDGDSGDGGPATSAQLSLLVSIALSPAGDILYIADNQNNRVRQVKLGTGVISSFAGAGWIGGFGYAGDGGPATSASFEFPEAVAVDASGNVFIGDTANCVVRKVDITTNIITTVAGVPGDCASGGDGNDARSAQLGLPIRVALDPAGNLFVLDTGARTIRRIDDGTNIITTVAGGGSTTPGFGDATTMDLGGPTDITVDATNNLFISAQYQVFKVDLGTGILSVFAGTGASGFSGDGGPAQDATFHGIGGVASRGDQILIADSENHRIRAVVPPPPPDNLVIDLATSQAVLDSLTAVPGSILMVNVDGREYLLIPNATSVGLNVTLTGNNQLLVIDLNALQSAGGSITISGNLALQSVDLSSLATVDGSLTITNNPALNAILISGVTSIGGNLTVVGTAATVIDVSALTTVTGSLDISGNTSATAVNVGALTDVTGGLTIGGNTAADPIDVGSLTTVGGGLDISGNNSATTIDVGSLTSVGGDLSISDNPVVDPIDVGNLTTVGGNLDISGNTAASSIDVGALTTVGGSLTINDNPAADPIDVGSLTTVGGDLTVVDNGDATVDVSALTEVSGDLTVETTGTGTVAVGDGATVTGGLTLDATGYTAINGRTPVGSLDLTATRLEAVIHLQIQAASFETPVSFTVNRVDPVALAPESGLNASGAPATIDPIAAYQFTFAVPKLNRDATLSFDITVAQLDPATQTALLGALAAGTATLVTKGDAPGSVFQAFPICVGTGTPTAGGCVRVETFDANGQPTTGTPTLVRFSNVIGHFSTWAVATVTNVVAPPQQQIADILVFFDASVAAGTLTGSGNGNSANGRRKALRNMIEAAGDLIQQGQTADACQQLADAANRTDGAPQPPDFVAGPAAAELKKRIERLRSTLGCSV